MRVERPGSTGRRKPADDRHRRQYGFVHAGRLVRAPGDDPRPYAGKGHDHLSTGGMFAAMLGMMAFGWAADALGATVSLIGIGLILLMTALLTAQFSRRCQTIQKAVMDPLPAA